MQEEEPPRAHGAFDLQHFGAAALIAAEWNANLVVRRPGVWELFSHTREAMAKIKTCTPM